MSLLTRATPLTQLYFFEERFRLQIEMLGRDPESIKAILQEVTAPLWFPCSPDARPAQQVPRV